jgi:hypothetical protein
MHKYRRKKPHQKQTRNGKTRTRTTLQAGRPRYAMVCDCLAHALLDLQGCKCIPASVPAQGSRQLQEFRIIQIGHHPVRRIRAVPVEDLVALRVLFPDGVVG